MSSDPPSPRSAMRPAALLVVLLAWVSTIRADGCKYALSGRFVPAREQRASIEWAGGIETLYVAARSDATSEGTVWVVPVRAAAASVQAEPVEEFPAVLYYDTLKRRAVQQLDDMIVASAVFDSGGLCGIMVAGGCDDKKASKAAEEVSRGERLGMIITVVTAESRTGLEQYLHKQGVNRAAADLTALEPYFGETGYAFVCGWVASRSEPSEAAALRIVFPSPTLWFPLRPTRAYAHPVETVACARGFVKPADGCDLPDLRCEYVFAHVKSQGVGQSFTADRNRIHPRDVIASNLSEMTRIILTSDPQKWDRDLELVPGTTAAGNMGLAVTGGMTRLALLWSALIGAAVGLVVIPLLAVPGAERRTDDWLAGLLIGATIAFSLWPAVMVFCLWRSWRFRGGPRRPARYLVLPALALAHFAVVLGLCYCIREWIRSAA